MNKIYKVIYNKNKHRYEVVSELAKSHGGKCKTTVATAGDTNWLRRLWMRVRGGVNKSDEDGNPVTMSISRAAMVALMCISVWSAAAVSSSWVEGASTDEVPVSVKYDETTGTIKIVKTDPNTNVETIVATYAVGGNISPITSIGDKNPTGIIAIGDQSKAVQSNTIAIGTDAHAGNVGGSDDTSGRIAIGTKTVASGDRSIALGNQSTSNKGSYNIAQGNDSIGIGTSTSVFGYSGVSIGRRNIIGIPDPELVSKDGVLTTKSKTKYSEDDLGGNSVIVGAYNVAYGNRSSIVGTYSRAMGSNSVAIGSGVQSLSDGSIAIGKGSGYEFEDASRRTKSTDRDYYGRDWELPPEYKVLKQVLLTDIAGDKKDTRTSSRKNGYFEHRDQPKYNNYGAGSSDPGGFIVEGKNALGIGTYTQVRGDSAIGLATGEMTADLSEKDKSQYAKDMRKIMDMEETLYEAKEALKAGTGDTAILESAVKAAEESLATAKKAFRETYLKKYSFVDGNGALGVGRQILAQGDRSMAVGDYAKAISNDAIAYGGQTLANGTNSVAMGGSAHVGTEKDAFANSMAIGSHTNVQAGNAVALGAFSEVTGENSLALGFGKQSGDAITYNSVSGKDSTLIGSYGTIQGNNSILIGSNGNIANDRVVGLGNNINIKAADQNDQENNTAGSVFLGDHAGYVKDSKRSRSLGQVDVVGSAGKMELTESLSSTKGALRDYTKDFIYIYMLERQDDGTQIGAPIAVRSDFAGGDSTVGVVSVGSTYEQKFNSLQDIKDYHTKVGSLITVPVDVTVQVTKNGVPLGKQQQTRYFAANSTRDTIYADNTLSEEDKAKVWDTIQKSISSSNTKYTVFETRRIQNVAPGLIGLNSTDAINGSQLFATNQMLGNLVGSLKKTLGDSVTVTEDGQITVAGDINTLGWIAKADTVGGSNGTVAYDADKKTDETEEAYQARIAKLKKDGYIVDASKVMTFKAGKNIGLVQKPGEFSISTIDTPSFTSVELRGETKEVNGSQVTPVTMMDSSGMQVYTETVTPGDAGPTTTKKVSTTVNNEGVTTDGTVKVTNGEDGGKDLVSLGKGSATTGETDQDFGTIHVDGKQGADGTITIDRGTKSLTDTANVGTNREQEIGANNPVAGMDRITYTTKGPNDSTINHEVATLDDGFFLTTSKDVTDKNAPAGVKLNHTIKFTDGANTKVSRVTSDNNGVHSLHIDVNGLPVVYTDEDGNKLTKVGDKFYKDDQFDNGTLKPNATPSEAKNISIVNPDGSISKTDGSAPTTVNNVGSSIGGEVNNGAPKGSTINGEPGNNSFIDNLSKVGGTGDDAISKNAVVTTGDLKNLADTSLFFAGDSADGVNEKGTTADKNAFGRKLSQQMKIVGGVDLGLQNSATADQRKKAIADKLTDGNIGVISDGTDTLTVKLAKQLKDLDSATYTSPTTKTDDGDATSTMKVDGNGVRFVEANGDTVNNTPTFTTDGITGGNKTITDVASGIGGEVKDAAHDNANTFLENVNKIGKEEGGQPAADAISENVVVNAKDLKNLVDTGFKLNTSGQLADTGASTVKIGETINVINGVNTKVSAIDDTVNGTHTFHIDVTGMPISYTDGEGNALTKIGDNYYKNTDIEDGKPKDNAVAVPADKVTNNVKVVNKDGGTTEQGSIGNVKSVFDSTIGNGGDTGSQIDGINDANKVEKVPGTNQFIKDLTTLKGDTPADKEKLNSVSTVGDLQKVALTPLFFEGDTAESATTKNAFGRKLSEKAKIIGGQTDVTKLTDGNIGVVSNGSDTLTIKLAKELKDLDSVKVSNGKDGDDAKDLVTIGKEVNSDAAPGTDGENGTIGLNGKNGSEAVITIDRGTKSMNDKVNLGTDPSQDISDTNTAANMDRITYTTKGPNNSTINHEVATLDDGFFLTTSKDVTDNKAAAKVKLNNTIKFTDGANTKVSTVDSKDGVHELHIDVTGLPVVYTDKDGNKLTKVGDKFYKDDQFDNGTLKPNATPSDAKNISIVNPDGSISKTDGSAPTTVNNVGSSIGGDVNNGAPTGSTINGERGTNSFIDNLNKVGGTGNDAISKNAVVTTGDLRNLADTSLFFSGDATDGKNGNVKNTFGRKLSEEAKIVGGVTTPANLTDNNIGVVSNGSDTLTIKLAKQLTGLDSATYTSPTTKADDATSTMKVDGNGIRFVGDNNVVKTDAPSLTTDGITGGNKQITNVGSGLKNGDTTISISDLKDPNKVPSTSPVLNNAVNVGDLKNIIDTGFKLNTSGQPTKPGASTVKIGDTINIIDGANTKVSAIDDSTTGTHTFHIDVNGLPVVYTDEDGNKLTKVGDKFYKDDQFDNGTLKPNATPSDAKNISIVNPDGSISKTDGSAPTTVNNVGSSIGGDVNNGAPTGSTINGERGTNSFIDNLNKVGGTGNDAISKNAVVTTGDLRNLADTSLFFSGDATDGKNGNVKNTFGRKLSEEAKIVGGVTTPANLTDNNIGVVSNGSDTLTIKLAKQLTGLDSATYTSPTTKADDATSTMKVDGNGIRFVGDKDTVKNDAPSLTTDGIDGGNKQITNVGSGLKDGDTTISMSDLDDSEKWPNTNPIWNNAVNVGDLKKAKDAATTEVTGTGKAIVTKTIGDKDQNIYNVHVDPVVDVVATDGKTQVVRGDDGKYYNPSDIENKTYIPNEDGNGGNWYNKSDIGPNGKPNTDAPVQNIDPVDVKNNFVNPNGTGSIVLDNVKSGIGGEVKDAAGNNTFIDNISKVGKKNDDGDAISENTVVNAKDLKNVVDTGFKLNTSGYSGDAQTVKIGETIKVVDGANTKVSDITSKDGVHEFHIDVTGLPVTYTATETDGEGKPTGTPVDVTKTKDGYQKADGTPLIKINENGKDVYYTADQLDNNVPKSGAKGLTITDNIRLINPKDGTGATKITNVAAGTDDTDAVNVSQLKEMAAGASTEVTGTGKAIVTSKKGDAGQTVYNVHVDPVVEVQSKDGSEVTRGGDGKYYKTSDIADKVYVPNADGNGGNWYNKTDVTDGKPNTGANPQTPAALKQSDIKTSLVNPNAGVDPTSTDNSIILDNVKSGIGGDAGNNGIPKDSTIDGTTGDNSFIKNLDTVGKAGGIDKNTVVNAGDLKNLADTPLFFTGDSADGVAAADGLDKNTFGRKLSEEMKIVGGVKLGVDANADPQARKKAIADKLTDGNIGVISDGTNKLTVKLAKELTDLTSVTTGSGDNTTTMTAGGTTTTSRVDDIVKTISTAPNGMTTTEQKVDATGAPTGESKTTMVTPDGVTVTTGTTDGQTTKTALNKDGLATDGKVVVTNGKDGDAGKELVTIDKVVDANAPAGTDGEHGQIGLDGKNGSEATITIDRGTKSLADGKNIALDPTKPVGENNPMSMDRITYATKGADGSSINHEVATMDDGFLLTTSGDVSAAQSPTKVAMNHTITIVDGANTKVSKVMTDSTGAIHELHIDVNGLPTTYVDGDGKPITKVGGSYVDADGETLVKVGDAYYRKSQLNNPDDPAAGVKPGEQDKGVTFDVKLVSPDGITNAPKLNNVGSSLVKGDGTRITMGDLNDSATYPATNPIWNSAVNVGDLKAASDAAKTEVTGTGAADVTKLTAADGHDVYNVHVDKLMTVTATDPSKTIKRGGDGKYYNEGDIDGKTFVPNGQGGGNWYNSTDVDQNTGKPLAGKNPLPSDQAPQALNQNELKNSIVNPNGDDPTVLDNVKSGIGGAVKDADKQDANTFLENVNKIGKKDGDQPTADAISENVVVNARDLKNLVDTGFKLNTSGQGDAGASTVKIGDTINVVDGANTKVSAITSTKDGTHTFHIDVTGLPMTYTAAQFDGDGKVVDGSTVNVSKVGDTYQTEDGTKLVNVGGKYYKPNQLDSNGQPKDGEQGLTVTNSISLQNPNSADDPATLKNVGSGLVDKNGKPVSIDEAVGTNAVNVNDLRKMGSAAKTEVKGTGAAEVTKLTADDGHEIYNVHVDKLMKVTAVTPNTDVTRGGDGKYYKAGDIADKTFVSDGNGGGDWYNSTDVDEKTGKPLDGKNPLPSDQTPQPMKQSDLKNSIVNPNGDGPTVVDNVKSVLDSASIGNGGADGSTIDGVGGNNEFIKQLTGLNPATAADKAKLNSVATVGDLQKVALTPLFFEGDSADGVPATDGTDKNTFGRKLSEKAKIVGGVDLGLQGTVTTEQRKQAIADKLTDKNIGVISNGSDTLTIKLAKDLTGLNSSVYTSLTPAGNDGDATSSMKLDGNGIRFIDGQGKAKTDAPSLTTDGIKGGNKQITDVADGLKNGDTIVSIDDLRNPSKSLKDSSVWTNAVNVNDLKKLVDAGFKLNTSGQGNAGASTVKIGDTINVVDGANTKVSAITSADDGTHTFHIDVTGLPVTYTATKTDANGAPTGEPVDVSKVGDGYQLADGTKLVKAGDKYYTPDQLENGKPKPDAEGLTIKESVSLTQDNSAPATLERVGSGRRNGMDASEKPMDWNTILNPTGENEDKVNNMLTNAANIGDVRDAMQSVTEAGKGGGFGLTGNNGTVTQDLGKTITVKGGIANAVDEKTGDDLNTPEKSTTDKNTYVNVKDITGADGTTSKEMVVEIAKDLTDLDSVTVGEVGADGNTDGVTKITKDGMNTKVVENGKTKSTDVSADGVTVTDADGRTNTSTATKNELVDGKNKNTSTATKNELTDGDNTNTSTATENKLTDKDGNTNTSTSTETKLSDKEGDKTTSIKAGDMTVSKKNDKGETGSTHVDGGTITLENKDKDGKALDAKTELSNKGMTITPVDKKGNPIDGKKVSLSDKGLNNGGNQIINVDSGLKNDKGQKVDINDIKDKDSMLNNAVNVGDLKEAMNKAKTEVGGSGAADVIPGTGKDGNPKYTVHVDKLVEAKADDGKAIVRGEDNKFYYKDESLKQGKDGKWYPQDKLDDDGNPKAGAVGKNIPILGTDPVPADKLKTSLVNPNDPNSKVKLDNIKSAIGGDVGNGAGSEDKVNGADGTNSFIDNLDKVGKEGGIGNDAAVTTGDLKNLADTPLFFGGDSADGESTDGKEHTNTFDRKLGKQINIKGEVDLGLGDNATAEERKAAIKKKLSDGNIGVISNGKDTLTVKLSKDLKDLNTIEVNDSISVGKDGDSTVIKGSETTSSFTAVATGPDGQPLYEVDKNGEVVRDANGDPIPVTKTSSTTTKGGTVTIKDSNVATGPDRKPLYKVDEKGNPVLDEKGHKIPITESSSTTTKGGITESVVEKAEVDGDKPLIDENGNPITSKSTTTTGGGKLATDVEKVKMVDGKPVTSHETTTIDGSHFESKDKDGNYTTINGGEIKSYDKDTNGSVTIKGDSLTASSKDENGHDKVTNISSDGFNSTATTFERDASGQIVRNPDTGLPKEVTNSTNINSDGFTATRTDSEGNEVLKTTMQNGNIAIEKPQPIIDPTTGEAYKVLDKDGNWVPAHGYTKISDNGFEIQGINQSGTGISKVRLSSEGLDNGGNRITHVAEGVAPDDAVNVSQLRGLTQNINNDIANVGANAAALAGLKAIQYDPLEPTQIMAAVGTYRGKQAAALGIAHYKNEDTMFHMGVSIGSDHTMANIGVTYKFGRTDEKKAVPDRYKAGPISSTYVLQDEMVALKEENARMRANDEKMNAAYDEILDLVKQLKQDNEEMKKKLEKLEKK
ncbi:ESPR-type extended signal peptide-containing protein [Veillonella magna]|nr:ESPR-type extended signal peptide-containing protein [Veillonella magna]